MDKVFMNLTVEEQFGDNKSDQAAGVSLTPTKIFEHGRSSQVKRAMSMRVSDKMQHSLDNDRFYTGDHIEEDF